jgi:hypothetical protein
LEIRYLGNRDANVFFALLTDFRDASEQTQPGDEELLAYVRSAVQKLNQTYQHDRPNIFYLFHRPRLWNACDQTWMGYERKRGKLEQFNALLRGGEPTAFSEIVGDVSILSSINYVITLDTDTQLPRDAARSLIGNMAHPLNRPVYDDKKGRIVEGYSILQPRASISLTSAAQSRFSQLFAGESGIDPYTREVSDVYQDLFGEGSFIGKGIYDVDAFRQAVDGRFPDNLILSHDTPTPTPSMLAVASAGCGGIGRSRRGCCRVCPVNPSVNRIHCPLCRCGKFSTTCVAVSSPQPCWLCCLAVGYWNLVRHGIGRWRSSPWCGCQVCCPAPLNLFVNPRSASG